MSIYTHIPICAEQISCGFNIFDKLEIFMTIFKVTMVGWFFKKCFQTSRSYRVFLCQISGLIFLKKNNKGFLLKNSPLWWKREKNMGISHVKFKVSSIFWWIFLFTLKGISIWNCTEIGKMGHPGFEPETSDFLFTYPNNWN